MENYTKGEVLEVPMDTPFPLDNSVIEMKVTAGSKLRNLLGYSMKKIKEPEVNQMTWNASGNAIAKAISCAEIMKRKNKTLHQITKLTNRRVEEYWEPQIEGLDRLKVNRDIPCISILLSKVSVDTADPGYQAPGCVDALWTSSPQPDKSVSSPPPHPSKSTRPRRSSPRKHSMESGHQGPSASGNVVPDKRQRRGKNRASPGNQDNRANRTNSGNQNDKNKMETGGGDTSDKT